MHTSIKLWFDILSVNANYMNRNDIGGHWIDSWLYWKPL